MTSPASLTPRQRQILVLAANGCTDDQIARQLGIIRYTVNRHLCDTYKALGARGRANAVAIGLKLQIIDADDIDLPDQQREGQAA